MGTALPRPAQPRGDLGGTLELGLAVGPKSQGRHRAGGVTLLTPEQLLWGWLGDTVGLAG